ncbi:MAG: hypothetical protein PHH10_07165 [Dysgonamonadaceae bacterium]|nr:hypothetical protein [Dysgonamonadaceae bacterium]
MKVISPAELSVTKIMITEELALLARFNCNISTSLNAGISTSLNVASVNAIDRCGLQK